MNLDNCCVGLFVRANPKFDCLKSCLFESRGLVYETIYETVYQLSTV